jgi:plasmid stabilization system protein ParE
LAYRLTAAAERQIDALLLDSAWNHGLGAAGRYGELILAVMAALGDDPGLLGSVAVPRLAGIRAYPIRLGRRRLGRGRRVAAPRHLVVYRLGADAVTEILGVVHDRMVLSRAARRLVRSAGRD